MAITGDRYVGTFHGRTLELVRDNWVKRLSLLIDGQEVAGESCMLPHDIMLTHRFYVGEQQHEIVARSTVKNVLGLPLDAEDGIWIDGEPWPVEKVK